MSGLVAAWVFQQCGADVKLFEPGPKGRGFMSGGLKYFVRTDELVRLVNDLGLAFSVQSVRGGILIHGEVQPYPRCFKTMTADQVKRIRNDHFTKTRGVEPGPFGETSMNDPFAQQRKSLSCDLAEFVRRLSEYRAHTHVKESIVSIDHVNRHVYTADRARWAFDHCIVTVPLWVARNVVKFPLPEGMAAKLNIVELDGTSPDPYARWDYVYTPYTPESLVHRLSPSDGGYSVEFNGEWTEETPGRLRNELNFLFGNAWALNDVKKGLPGHLLPLNETAEWPDDVQPLGRFAAWDPRATTDKTLSSAIALARKWGFTYDDD